MPHHRGFYSGTTAAQEVARARREAEFKQTCAQQRIIAAVRPRDIEFRSIHLDSLNRHVIALAIQHGVNVVARQVGGGGCAHAATRTIEIPPVTDETSYAVALHEFGHLLSPDGDSRQYRHVISGNSLIAIGGEIGAWRWALKHAQVWTRGMQDELYRCLLAYAGAAADDDERFDISSCVTQAALKIADKPWTFKKLNEACASIRRT